MKEVVRIEDARLYVASEVIRKIKNIEPTTLGRSALNLQTIRVHPGSGMYLTRPLRLPFS